MSPSAPPTRRELRLLARDLYVWPSRVDFLGDEPAAAVVRIGLHARSQRLLKSLCFLDEIGLEDCGDSIVRAMFDVASACIWLGDEATADERLSILLRSHQRDAHLLASTGMDVYVDLLASATDIADELAANDVAAKLPSIEQRIAGHPLADHYYRYRDLCRHSHASYTASTMYLDLEKSDSDSIQFTADRAKRFSTHFLAYGCVLVLTEAAELVSEGLLEEPGGFREVGEGVWKYWRSVEGKDPTGPVRP